MFELVLFLSLYLSGVLDIVCERYFNDFTHAFCLFILYLGEFLRKIIINK